MIVASHQIDLLPYFGFFNRMKNADIFDLGGHYDVWRKGNKIFQHRVKVGKDDKFWWITMPVIEAETQDQVRLRKAEVPKLFNKIQEAYRYSPKWSLYCDFLKDRFYNPPEFLWQFNLDLILWMRDEIGIKTPLSISMNTRDHVDDDGELKILKQLKSYGDDIVYYSGIGGINYVDAELYNKNGIHVRFQDTSKIQMPEGFRTVSLLSAMMRFDNKDVYDMIGGFEVL